MSNNRLVSIEKGTYTQVQNLSIPENGLGAYLKGFGHVKIFRMKFKNEFRYYILYQRQSNKLQKMIYEDFKTIHDNHWHIEQFHRAIKQVCHIEHFQVRNTQAIKNHIFCAISAFVKLELMRANNLIGNWYEIQKNLFLEVLQNFIKNDFINYIT